MRKTFLERALGALFLSFAPLAAFAQDQAAEAVVAVAEVPALDAGNTAWMITSTCLVLMMAIPGLALFYGGMVRKKNVLSVLMQVFATVCIVSLVWMVIGYSLAFTDGTVWLGGMDRFFLNGMGIDSRVIDLQTVTAGSPWFSAVIPESVFMMFQMTFAAITPALIVGAFVDRMKFATMLVFMVLWSTRGLRPDRPLGLVAQRLPVRRRRARLRRRHGRAHQCRRRRARGLPAARQARSASAASTWRRTISS